MIPVENNLELEIAQLKLEIARLNLEIARNDNFNRLLLLLLGLMIALNVCFFVILGFYVL